MAEGTPSSLPSERQSEPQSDRHRNDEGGRGERASAPREGGFRIRLSDNEMRSARALQEAFGLRSTVAVLGFALRTLGQQLEEGKLDELAAQHRAQMGSRGPGGGGRPEGRRERPEGRGSSGRWQDSRGAAGGGSRGQRVDPFARPSRPAVPVEALQEEPPLEEEPLLEEQTQAAPSEVAPPEPATEVAPAADLGSAPIASQTDPPADPAPVPSPETPAED